MFTHGNELIYHRGIQARRAGILRSSCPADIGDPDLWLAGWDHADEKLSMEVLRSARRAS